jgi:TPR repeat protein
MCIAYSTLCEIYGSGHYIIEPDVEKIRYYSCLAAMRGVMDERVTRGDIERKAGNYSRAYKHFLIAARAGYQESLKDVREGFEAGYVTKDEYAHALREFQRRRDEAMSDDRGENSCHFM